MNSATSAQSKNRLVYVADSEIHERGLFAAQNIPAGTLIGHYDGPETRQNGRYVLWVQASSDGEHVKTSDGECSGTDHWLGYDGNNELRFLNHAARPNGEMDGLDLYALHDISTDEEITIDYGEEFSDL
jgi:hypothetical protein